VPSLHLLDPYRSTLLSLAYDDGLARETVPGIAGHLFRAGRHPETRHDLLQLLALYDDVSTFWSDPWPEMIAAGLPGVVAQGLRSCGICSLVDARDDSVKWTALDGTAKAWRMEADSFDTYYTVVLDQLVARGIPIHYSLARLLRAWRLGEVGAIPLILSTVPIKLRPVAARLLADDPEIEDLLDQPILDVLCEVRIAISRAERMGGQIAATRLDAEIVPAVSAATQLLEIVVSELLDQDLVFPQPRNLSEALELRHNAHVKEFRDVYFQWLTTFMPADISRFQRLRRDVVTAAKSFRRLPHVQRFARLSGYASVAVGIVEALVGMAGPSIVLGLTGLGLDRLATVMKRSTNWLYICRSKSAG